MAIKCRRFQGEQDYFKLREFLQESISVSGPKFYFNLNELEFGIDIVEGKSFLESITEELGNSFFWFEDDKLIGGIWPFNKIQLFINPKNKHLFNEMFKTAKEAVNEFIKEGSEDIGISDFNECSWCPFDGDTELEDVLIENGYCKTDEYWVLRYFNYSEPVEEPRLPKGYYIKTLEELSDISEVIHIYSQCLGMDFNEQALRNTRKFDTYRNELDIIVMGPEHTPVALCSGRYDEKNRMVSFEAVACFREHRKKGISKAMMLYALKAARGLGAEVSTVLTLTPEQFPAPNRLYEAAGFKLVGNRYTWKKASS
ncbi:MAG: GNAT family N-acetyltransferase [Clostridium sp.]|uniref:GNAT family N-acetyltransferase n=1 Tax=Clostridium sp. TaxID=1506 RepID=UPI003D6CF593